MRRVLVLLAVAAAALLAGSGQQAAAVNNQLQVDADTATPGIQNSVVVSPSSGPFNVEVRVDTVQTRLCTDYGISQPCGLGAYTIDLTFNKNIIQCQDVDPGTPGCQNVTNEGFLTSTGRLIFSCGPAAGNDPDYGVIRYTCVTTGDPQGGLTPLGPNGVGGLLATVRFKLTPGAIGTSTLNISQSALTDITATPICHPNYTPCDVQNGEVVVNYKADLRVTKTAPSPVAAPGTISYTLNVTNLGPDQAQGVSLVDSLPPEVSFSSASAECTYDGGQHKVNCDLGTLTNGQNKTINITASVAASQAGKSTLNKADVTTTSLDQVSSNNHAEATTQVAPSTVTLTKTVPQDVGLNAPGQYTIVANSTGSSAAVGVTVTDVLPSQVSYNGVSTTKGSCNHAPATRTVTCGLDDMPPATSATITINVTFGGTPAIVCNTANVTWTPSGTGSSGSRCTYVALPDTDGDGCRDMQELGLDPALGGQRNPNNPYDFYDVPIPVNVDQTPNGVRNKAVNLQDVVGVLKYVGTSNGGPANGSNVDYDSLKDGDWFDGVRQVMFPDGVVDDWDKVGRQYDRSPPAAPNPPWAAGPPNGAVNLQDVVVVLREVGHGCA